MNSCSTFLPRQVANSKDSNSQVYILALACGVIYSVAVLNRDRGLALWVLSTGGARAKPYVAMILRLLEDQKCAVRYSAVDALGDLASVGQS